VTQYSTVEVLDKKAFAAEFYRRQVTMRELGWKGQRKLEKAKVAVVGVGGLGTVSALYLALAGVGHLRLIDQDTVETPNLHRQILYTTDDLHYPKVEAAAERLMKLNPLVEAEAVSENVNSGNVERLLFGVDVVVDGLDNMVTRYLINRVCVKHRVPYVFGAAIGLEGNLSVFSPPETGCLQCLLPNLSDGDLLTCDTRGVLGATPGIIGAMQAMEAIKILAGVGSPLKGKLMVCDFNDMNFATIDISKAADCKACSGVSAQVSGGERLVWLCGSETANINPEKPLKLNLDQVYEVVQKRFPVRVKSHLAVIFDYKGHEVSLFNGGRMLLKNVKDENAALRTYREILKTLKIDSS
jgi:molybdopterin/thiamine biosynthesis adenylyltransferase